MNEQAIRYALAKQVPDMDRGFTVATSYGDIVIEPGRHADAIAAAVRRALEIQLKTAALARRDAELDAIQAAPVALTDAEARAALGIVPFGIQL